MEHQWHVPKRWSSKHWESSSDSSDHLVQVNVYADSDDSSDEYHHYNGWEHKPKEYGDEEYKRYGVNYQGYRHSKPDETYHHDESGTYEYGEKKHEEDREERQPPRKGPKMNDRSHGMLFAFFLV